MSSRLDNFDKNIKSKYLKEGIMLFVVGILLIISFLCFTHFKVVNSGIHKVNDVLTPFYIGIIMAYLLTPIFNFVTKKSYKVFKGKFKKNITGLKFAKGIATFVSLLVLIAVVSGFVLLVVPGTIESVISLVPKVEPAVSDVLTYIQNHVEKNPQLVTLAEGRLDDLGTELVGFIQEKFLPAADNIVSGAYSAATGAIGAVFNILIAVIICAYLLNNKETFAAQGKKWILATTRPEKAKNWFELFDLTNNTIGGFINGKILDSIIMGILCAIFMLIFKMPLVALVSVIVGVTNIIPFFGPFIGGIPGALLIMIVDPMKGIGFGILILALQQFDGNILGPAILGKTTNLSSFWVLFAIMVAGGFFGFIGMILGVPVFSIIYVYIGRAVDKRLEAKNYDTVRKNYENFKKYGIDDKDEIYAVGGDEETKDNTKEPEDIAEDTEDRQNM